MENREQPFRVFVLLCLWLTFSGCGGDDGLRGPDPSLNPDRNPSCETLVPRVLEDPGTGGEFHCLWCNREWTWTLGAHTRRLFVLIAVTCERLGSEAYLEIRDPRGSLVWQQPVKQGEAETYCVLYENPPEGILSVGLYGRRDLLPIRNLIDEFRGSLYLKTFNERGEWIRPSG
jgi:hypothetical protein